MLKKIVKTKLRDVLSNLIRTAFFAIQSALLNTLPSSPISIFTTQKFMIVFIFFNPENRI